MPNDQRSSKRRRISPPIDDLSPAKQTPSTTKPRSKRASAKNVDVYDDFDGAHTSGKRRKVSSQVENSTPTGRSKFSARTAPKAGKARQNDIQNGAGEAENNHSEANNTEGNHSEDEPRRSSRKRKSTTKAIEASHSHTNSGRRTGPDDTHSGSDLGTIDVATPNLKTSTAARSQLKISEKKLTSHDVDAPPKKRGRPPKNQSAPTSTSKPTPQNPISRHHGAASTIHVSIDGPADESVDELSQTHVTSTHKKTVKGSIDPMAHDQPTNSSPPKKKRGRPPKVPLKTSPATLMDVDDAQGRSEQSFDELADPIGYSQAPFSKTTVIRSKPTFSSLPPTTLNSHEPGLSALLAVVLKKLSLRKPIPLTHLDNEYSQVYQLCEATVASGEGNSMLLIGSRGTGKSTLVNKVLSTLSDSQKEDFHVIRLNGFIQTDDKLALREIWRQLGREMEVEEEGGKSYSDTLAMLLALLSHPDEISPTNSDQVAKSVIFIMDEFDLFASHARQTLLYNLLDIAQSRKAPIAVIGLTTKIDVAERLEKRVKSRFSHRYVHLSLPRSIIAFQDICKAALLIKPDELTFGEHALSKTSAITPKKTSQAKDLLTVWNQSVHDLFDDAQFISSYIRPTFYLTKSVATVLSTLQLPVSTLPLRNTPESTLLDPKHFAKFAPPLLAPPPSSLDLILPGLSELQLALLISAARLDIIHDTDTCTFGMAYAEYVDLASKARQASSAAGALAVGAATRVWGKEVARGEWESLIEYSLLVPVNDTLSGRVGSTTASLGGLVRVDVKLEEIPGAVPGLSAVLEKWCKHI